MQSRKLGPVRTDLLQPWGASPPLIEFRRPQTSVVIQSLEVFDCLVATVGVLRNPANALRLFDGIDELRMPSRAWLRDWTPLVSLQHSLRDERTATLGQRQTAPEARDRSPRRGHRLAV